MPAEQQEVISSTGAGETTTEKPKIQFVEGTNNPFTRVTSDQLKAILKSLPKEIKNAVAGSPAEEFFKQFRKAVEVGKDHVPLIDRRPASKRKSNTWYTKPRAAWNIIIRETLLFTCTETPGVPLVYPACIRDHDDGCDGQWALHFYWQDARRKAPTVDKVREKLGKSALRGNEEDEGEARVVVDCAPPIELQHNLRYELTNFVGRAHEKQQIKDRLSKHRLVTLIGVGGAGKTRLALEVGWELLCEYSDRIRFVELAEVSEGQIIAKFASCIRLSRTATQAEVIDELVPLLGQQSMLLIVDNCEQVAQACADVVEGLLRRKPNLRVLATSRERLRVEGESVCSVSALAVPQDGNLLSLADLKEFDAIKLFCEYARGGDNEFQLDDENAPDVAKICRRLDGIAMCIVLAASRVKCGDSARSLSRSLDDLFGTLNEGSRTAPTRHQTAKALIDWSYDPLSLQEKLLFQRLAALRGGWTAQSAAAICSGTVIAAKDVEKIHRALLLRSLISEHQQVGRENRFRLLEPIREYARQRLADSDEALAVHRRHLEHFAHIAQDCENALKRSRNVETGQHLEQEVDNFRTAIEWALRLGDKHPDTLHTAMGLVASLRNFWVDSGRRVEGERHLRTLLDHSSAKAPTILRCRALMALCGICSVAGDEAAPSNRSLAEESLSIAEALSDASCQAEALGGLAAMSESILDWDAAAAFRRRALTTWKAKGSVRGMCESLIGLSRAARNAADQAEVRSISGECLQRARGESELLMLGNALRQLAVQAQHEGRFADARVHFAESLELTFQTGSVRGCEMALAELTRAYIDDTNGDMGLELQGRYVQRCIEFFKRVLDASRRNDDVPRILQALFGLVCCARVQGDAEAAVVWLDDVVVALGRSRMSRPDSAPVLRAAFEYTQLGMLRQAGQLADDGLELARQLDNRDDVRWGLILQAMNRSALGQHAESVQRFMEAADLARHSGHATTIAFGLYMQVNELLRAGRIDDADTAAHEAFALNEKDIDLDWKGTFQLLRGTLALARRRYPDAEKHYRESLRIFVRSGRVLDIATAIQAHGIHAAAISDMERAAKLFGAAVRPAGADYVFTCNPRSSHFEHLALHWLGADAYAKAFDAGKRMPIQAVIKFLGCEDSK